MEISLQPNIETREYWFCRSSSSQTPSRQFILFLKSKHRLEEFLLKWWSIYHHLPLVCHGSARARNLKWIFQDIVERRHEGNWFTPFASDLVFAQSYGI